MKVTSTASRLKEIMQERGIRQVDILNAAKPYCAQYGIKLEKNDLSQYVNGKVEPGQEKLTILGLALNVSETWLMGYDVTPSRSNLPASDSQDAASALENRNIIKIAGRDGSYRERHLTDEQLAAFNAMLDALPEAPDDL